MTHGEKTRSVAFRAVHEASEKIRAAGLSGADVWLCLFDMLQDLQAADLGMGSDQHRDVVEEQCDDLERALVQWDDPVLPDTPQ